MANSDLEKYHKARLDVALLPFRCGLRKRKLSAGSDLEKCHKVGGTMLLVAPCQLGGLPSPERSFGS